MARTMTTEIESAKNGVRDVSHWLIDLFLPASGAYSAESFYFAQSAITTNGHNYLPRLKEKPQISQPLGQAPDGGSIKIDNTDGVLGQTILARGRSIEKGTVAVWKAFKIGLSYQLDKHFDCEIRDANVSRSDNSVTLKIVSDLFKRNAIIGGFPLTQRCIATFNANGILSPDDSFCGWQSNQGGDAVACLKTEDACDEHFNLWRIEGVPGFALVQITRSDTSGSGWDTGGGTGGSGGRDDYPMDLR